MTVPALPPAGDLLIPSLTGDPTAGRLPEDREVDAPFPTAAAPWMPARARV